MDRLFPASADPGVYPGTVFSGALLLTRVWGRDFGGDVRTVDVHACGPREEIEAAPANAQRIVTVRRSGYRFEG